MIYTRFEWAYWQIMQIDPRRPPHLKYLKNAGALPSEAERRTTATRGTP